MGWKAVGEFPRSIPKYIVIVAPHTSGWDFIIGVFFRSVLKLDKAYYLGKKELFRPPFGFLFRWLGGYPVDRGTSHNLVDQVAAIFDKHQEFILALSPEGTRRRVDRLRTGFYNIAQKANVPVVMVGFDYKRKLAIISEPMVLSNNQVEDFERILAFYRPIQGKHPELGLTHL
jgi:1-acyl-sn-glycerol-3-phosphate acyltransferase